MKRVLVSGGNGFLAQNLVTSLRQKNYDVWTISRKPISHETKNIQADFTDFKDLCAKLTGHSFDVIVHSAAHIPEPEMKPDLEMCQKVNFTGTDNLLRYAVENKIQNFLYLSSLAIFDNCSIQNIDEQTIPCPRSDYGNSKLAAEYLCRLYTENHGLTIPILRIGTIYGPGMNKDRMINFFVERCRANENFEVYNANLVLNTVYVDDVTTVIEKIIEKGRSTIYHLATGSQSKEQIVQSVISALKSKSQVLFKQGNLPAGNTFLIQKLKSEIFNNEIQFLSFEQGIQKYIKVKYE